MKEEDFWNVMLVYICSGGGRIALLSICLILELPFMDRLMTFPNPMTFTIFIAACLLAIAFFMAGSLLALSIFYLIDWGFKKLGVGVKKENKKCLK